MTPVATKKIELFSNGHRLGDFTDELDLENPLVDNLVEVFSKGSIPFINQAVPTLEDFKDAGIELKAQILGTESAPQNPPTEQDKEAQAAVREAEFIVQRGKETAQSQQQARQSEVAKTQKDAERLGLGSLEEVNELNKVDTQAEGKGYMPKIGSSIRATLNQLLATGIGAIILATKKIEWRQSAQKKVNNTARIFAGRTADLNLNKIAEGGSMLSSTGGNAG